MGDYCYMQLTCRRQDVPRFEKLDFVELEDGPTADTCVMHDEQANYANNGKMPVKNKNEIVTNEPSLEPKAAQSDLP